MPDGVPDTQADSYKIKIGFNPVASGKRTISPAKISGSHRALALGVVLLDGTSIIGAFSIKMLLLTGCAHPLSRSGNGGCEILRGETQS